MKTSGVGEGILNGESHVGNSQLCLDTSVGELNGAMNDAFGVNHDLDVGGSNVEEPLGFNHLKALVHEGGRVDGNLCAHFPIGVAKGLSGCYFLHLLLGERAEGASRGGEQDFLNLIIALARNGLKNG